MSDKLSYEDMIQDQNSKLADIMKPRHKSEKIIKREVSESLMRTPNTPHHTNIKKVRSRVLEWSGKPNAKTDEVFLVTEFWRRIVKEILYGTYSIVVIHGEHGSGKDSFIKFFFENYEIDVENVDTLLESLYMYTDEDLLRYLVCKQLAQERGEMLWGKDELRNYREKTRLDAQNIIESMEKTRNKIGAERFKELMSGQMISHFMNRHTILRFSDSMDSEYQFKNYMSDLELVQEELEDINADYKIVLIVNSKYLSSNTNLVKNVDLFHKAMVFKIPPSSKEELMEIYALNVDEDYKPFSAEALGAIAERSTYPRDLQDNVYETLMSLMDSEGNIPELIELDQIRVNELTLDEDKERNAVTDLYGMRATKTIDLYFNFRMYLSLNPDKVIKSNEDIKKALRESSSASVTKMCKPLYNKGKGHTIKDILINYDAHKKRWILNE